MRSRLHSQWQKLPHLWSAAAQLSLTATGLNLPQAKGSLLPQVSGGSSLLSYWVDGYTDVPNSPELNPKPLRYNKRIGFSVGTLSPSFCKVQVMYDSCA